MTPAERHKITACLKERLTFGIPRMAATRKFSDLLGRTQMVLLGVLQAAQIDFFVRVEINLAKPAQGALVHTNTRLAAVC